MVLRVGGNLESDIYFGFLLIKDFFVHLPLTRGECLMKSIKLIIRIIKQATDKAGDTLIMGKTNILCLEFSPKLNFPAHFEYSKRSSLQCTMQCTAVLGTTALTILIHIYVDIVFYPHLTFTVYLRLDWS